MAVSETTLIRRRTTGPEPRRQDRIIRHIRDRIIQGQIGRGERLPTRRALAAMFGVNLLTVQRAMAHLSDDGYVCPDQRRASVAAMYPPHLFRFAMPFSASPKDPTWSRFWSVLLHSAQELERQHEGLAFSPYYAINDSAADVHGAPSDHARLLQDASHRRIGGILLPVGIELLQGSPLLEMPAPPPIVALGRTEHPGVCNIRLNQRSFIAKALAALHERGRSRIAVLAPAGFLRRFDTREEMLGLVHEHGCASRMAWVQVISAQNDAGTAGVTELLMHDPDDRPDGLVVCDDHAVEAVAAGLLASAARIRQDLDVVVYCNFPTLPQPLLPFIDVGFDSREIVRTAFDTFRRFYQEPAALPAVHHIEARRLEEVNVSDPPPPNLSP